MCTCIIVQTTDKMTNLILCGYSISTQKVNIRCVLISPLPSLDISLSFGDFLHFIKIQNVFREHEWTWMEMNASEGWPSLSNTHQSSLMNINGHSWTVIGFHGHSWAFMDIHGHLWTVMDIHGYSWTFMGNHWHFINELSRKFVNKVDI